MDAGKFKRPERIAGGRDNMWVEFVGLSRQLKPVDLGLGFPDFAPPKFVTEALGKIATCKDDLTMHQCARHFGHERLVNHLSEMYGKLLGKSIDPMEEVLVCLGATHALYCTILGHVQEGDEVIIIEPYFDCYEPMVKMAGGTPIFIPLRWTVSRGEVITSAHWVLDSSELSDKFNDRTKAIIVNTPHNPLGKVFSHRELEVIADLAKKWDTLVIADEVYEWITFSGHQHVRIASLPGMWDRTVTIGSAGKSLGITGWRLGWAYGPRNLMSNLHAVHLTSVNTCPKPLQEAIANGLEQAFNTMDTPQSYFNILPAMLEEKRDKMAAFLQDAGFTPVIPEGGFFMLADFSAIGDKICLDESSGRTRDYVFSLWLMTEMKLAVIPPSAFFSADNSHLAKDYVRLCFAKDDSTLEKAKLICANLKKHFKLNNTVL